MALFQLKKKKSPPSPVGKRVFYMDPAEFLKDHCKKEKHSSRIVHGILLFGFLLLGTWGIVEQFLWEKRVQTWVTVQGAILKNGTRRVRSGRRTRTVSDLEYSYTYKGRSYSGKRIAYAEDHYPARYRKGARRPILVNPAKPSDSAAMVYFKKSGHALRYFKGGFFLVIALVSLSFFLRSFRGKEPDIPEDLKKYLAQFSLEDRANLEQEMAQELSGLSRSGLSIVPFTGKERYACMERYWILGSRINLWILIVTLLFIAVMLIPGVFHPVMLLQLGIWGIVMAFILFPPKLVLDLHEKRLYTYRVFLPEEKNPEKCIAFDQIRFLYLRRNTHGKNTSDVYCAAELKDGTQAILFRVAPRHMKAFLEFLAPFAKRLSSPMILFEKD